MPLHWISKRTLFVISEMLNNEQNNRYKDNNEDDSSEMDNDYENGNFNPSPTIPQNLPSHRPVVPFHAGHSHDYGDYSPTGNVAPIFTSNEYDSYYDDDDKEQVSIKDRRKNFNLNYKHTNLHSFSGILWLNIALQYQVKQKFVFISLFFTFIFLYKF